MKLFIKSLYIVSTPIGNLDDITIRAIEVLKKSDIILCEDTRHSLKLLNHLKIKKKLISYHKFNEKKELNKIIQHLNEGKILSLISDAGTPALSDPGRLLIQTCIKENIKIVPIPGVSSITASMSVSGFKDQFLFYGFLPKTVNELEKVLSSLSRCSYCQVFFIPAIKINFYMKMFKKFFIDREILIAKEDAPGIGIILILLSIHKFTKIRPGSDNIGVPASEIKDKILPLLICSMISGAFFFSLNL